MAYTAAQQAKLTAAQKLMDQATSDYLARARTYQDYHAGITCYGDVFQPSEVAGDWWNPQRTLCTSQGGCTHDDKNSCQANIDYLNQYIIPPLRSTLQAYKTAQNNYATVLSQVTAESGADPVNVTNAAAAAAAAEAAEEAKTKKLKYILIFTAVVIVVLVVVYVYFKWFRKK